MAFEHHPGLHALWLRNEQQASKDLVRTTTKDLVQATEEDKLDEEDDEPSAEPVELKAKRRARRRKPARDRMDN
jgi:hypothetical protein